MNIGIVPIEHVILLWGNLKTEIYWPMSGQLNFYIFPVLLGLVNFPAGVVDSVHFLSDR